MTNLITYDEECTIYPGGYVPALNDNEVEKFMHQPHKHELTFPPVNITELSGSFKVEVAIPGARREDFLINADDHRLSVSVLFKNRALRAKNEKREFRDKDYECMNRDIKLPENADPEFVSAEYKDGILCLYAFKTKKSNRHSHSTIAVY